MNEAREATPGPFLLVRELILAPPRKAKLGWARAAAAR
jgi:hypothetical protein